MDWKVNCPTLSTSERRKKKKLHSNYRNYVLQGNIIISRVERTRLTFRPLSLISSNFFFPFASTSITHTYGFRS